MRRCRKRTRKGERKVDPPRRQPVQRVFGRLALTVGPRIHLLRYRERFRPTRGPTPTNSGPYPTERTLPPVLAAHNSLQPRPSNVIYGGHGDTRGRKRFAVEKGSRWKRVEEEEPCTPLCLLCHVPLGQVNGGKCRCNWTCSFANDCLTVQCIRLLNSNSWQVEINSFLRKRARVRYREIENMKENVVG